MAKNIVFVTTEWGFKKGGVNSFNFDLCNEFAKAMPSEIWKVYCLVNMASNEEIKQCKQNSIQLISLNIKDVKIENTINGKIEISPETVDFDRVDPEIILMLLQLFSGRDTVFVGHDIFSTDFATQFCNFLKEKGINSMACAFHHMNYEAYHQMKGYTDIVKSSESFKNKIEHQKRIFKEADIVFGVGPKLQQSAIVKRRKNDVKRFIPGMPVMGNSKYQDVRLQTILSFKAITWGRVEIKNDKIKQYSLAVAAFSGVLNDDEDNTLFSQDSKINIIGVADEQTDDWLTEISLKYGSNRCFNSITESDRNWLIENLLIDSHVSLMLSTHEGFGLVGLESIAACVPLIISRNTGLYELLIEMYGKKAVENYVISVKIKGHPKNDFNEGDLVFIKNGLLRVRQDFKAYLKRGKIIKSKFERKYSWEKAIDGFQSEILYKIEQNKQQKENLEQSDNSKLKYLIAECRQEYLDGNIEKSFDTALMAIESFPNSSASFLRLTKAAIRLDKKETIEKYLKLGLIEKDDNYYYSLIQFERTFNKNYKRVLNYFEKIKNKENLNYNYEAGVANFFMISSDTFGRTIRKANKKINAGLTKSIKYLNRALHIALEHDHDHWWVDVMLLLIYKSYPNYIEPSDWRVSKEQTINDLNNYIKKYPLKASPKIYRILVLIIFENLDDLMICIAEDSKLLSENPHIFLPLDFIDSISIKVLFLYENDLAKLEQYNKVVEDYIKLYKNKSK